MINQTSFVATVIPQGGAINEVVTWDASVPSGETFPFAVFSGYGSGTDPSTFVEAFRGFGKHDWPLTGPLVDARQVTNVGYIFDSTAPVGTYDCLTMVGYIDLGQIHFIDWKIDTGILTIEAGLSATIVSTSFAKV